MTSDPESTILGLNALAKLELLMEHCRREIRRDPNASLVISPQKLLDLLTEIQNLVLQESQEAQESQFAAESYEKLYTETLAQIRELSKKSAN